jgi:hypothetical protein
MILSMWWEAYQWTSCCGCMAGYIDGLSVLSCATNPIPIYPIGCWLMMRRLI